jgi:hypothetical protein
MELYISRTKEDTLVGNKTNDNDNIPSFIVEQGYQRHMKHTLTFIPMNKSIEKV